MRPSTGRRAVITGLGAVSCLGRGVEAFWRGLLAGGGAPSVMDDPYARMAIPLKYLVPKAAVPDEPRAVAGIAAGRGIRMAVAAAWEAIADAGLDDTAVRELTVVLGVEMGNAEVHEAQRVAGGPGKTPHWAPMTVSAAAVGAAIGAVGGNIAVGNACAASAYGLTIAADMIGLGEIDVALVGGGDLPSRVPLGAFNRLGAVDPVRCRPFDRHRAGTVFGEGAALLVVESAEHAAARGVTGYAEVAGTAWSCDAHHPTAPDPEGSQALRAMRAALGEADIDAAEIGVVIPHGTGTALNDLVESRALRAVFGDRCDSLPLLSLKGMIGHTGGVAGAFGCVAAALMLRHAMVPPSATLDEQDPECAVRVPQGSPVPLAGDSVLVNAYAFGGNNASLVVKRPGSVR